MQMASLELANKKVVVIGMGKTGIATAAFLKRRQARVMVTDTAGEKDLTVAAAKLKSLGATMAFGSHQSQTFDTADLIILSPGVPHTLPELERARARGVPVMGEIELASRFIQEPIVAITGTNGKTTVTELTGAMLKGSGLSTFVGGNIGTPLIEYVDRPTKAHAIVIEVSSFQLDTIETFRPHVAVVLNITADHLDRYPNETAYAQSKARIFMNQRSDDIAVLNNRDPMVHSISRTIQAQKFYFESDNDENLTVAHNRLAVAWPAGQQTVFDLSDFKLQGRHNRENAAAASLAALAAGGQALGIQQVLNKFRGLPHRLEHIATVNDVGYFNDSKATNVGAVIRALENFTQPVILILGGRNKGIVFDDLTKPVCRNTKKIIAIGEARKEIQSVLEPVIAVEAASSMVDAVQRAQRASEPGDIVLLSPACASFDMYASYAQRGEDFRRAVEKLEKDAT